MGHHPENTNYEKAAIANAVGNAVRNTKKLLNYQGQAPKAFLVDQILPNSNNIAIRIPGSDIIIISLPMLSEFRFADKAPLSPSIAAAFIAAHLAARYMMIDPDKTEETLSLFDEVMARVQADKIAIAVVNEMFNLNLYWSFSPKP